MNYQYTYRTTARDIWQLSMYHIYGSMAGVGNILITAGAAALIITRWQTAPVWQRLLMVICLLLFPVIQPLAVYGRARKQASGVTQDITLRADGQGIHIAVGKERSDLPWSSVRRISKKPTLLVIYSDTTHGFILSNRVLGQEREAFFQYVYSRIRRANGGADGTGGRKKRGGKQ